MESRNTQDFTLEDLDKLYNENIEEFNALPPKVKLLYRVSRINNILGTTDNDSIVRSIDILKSLSTKGS